jgi:hypothetical protein
MGKFLWNNDTAMARMCSSLHQHEFDNLFSVSDEAFVLLLIDNYAAPLPTDATAMCGLNKLLRGQPSLQTALAPPH